MKHTNRWLLAVMVLMASGCEQESQPLPFSTSTEAEVTRSIPATGATLSTAAGASVQFPAGAVDAGTVVSLQAGVPAGEAQRSGTPVSTGYRLEPAGMTLARPAPVELRIQAARRDSLWLASVVNVSAGGVREHGGTRVDLATGVVRSRIGKLGTLTVVVPEAAAIVPIRWGARMSAAPVRASLAAAGTDSVAADCGGPGSRCEGLSLEVSENLMNQVENAALVYPYVSGGLRIEGARASGSLHLSTSLRAQLRSGTAAEAVEVNAAVGPTEWTRVTETATQIVFSFMRFMVTGAAESDSAAQEQVADLVISKSGATSPVQITRIFWIDIGNGLEMADVTVTFPVRIHQ